MTERSPKEECWDCVNRRPVAGSFHISCAKPDFSIKANIVGVRKGWFFYPYNFDPVWKESLCQNWEDINENT